MQEEEEERTLPVQGHRGKGKQDSALRCVAALAAATAAVGRNRRNLLSRTTKAESDGTAQSVTNISMNTDCGYRTVSRAPKWVTKCYETHSGTRLHSLPLS